MCATYGGGQVYAQRGRYMCGGVWRTVPWLRECGVCVGRGGVGEEWKGMLMSFVRDPEQVCLGACSVWVLDLYRKDFTT